MTTNNDAYMNADWIEHCATGFLVLDPAGRIKWLNKALENLLEAPAAELLGQTRESKPDYRALFDGDEMLHLHSNQSSDRWLRCETKAVTGPDGDPAILHLYFDMTAQVQLQQQRDELQRKVEALNLTDGLTGLANQRALTQFLQNQVTRSRRYKNPLSLGLLLVDAQDPENGESTTPSRLILRDISRCLRDRLRWVDQVGRYTDNCFMMVLPETHQAAAQELFDKVLLDVEKVAASPVASEVNLILHFGITQWEKGDDPQRLIDRAMALLNPVDQQTTAGSHG